MLKGEVSGCPNVDATSPLQFTPKTWLAIAVRVFKEISDDNIPIIAAGVAFYTLLAIFPMISVALSLYGLIFDDPEQVQQHLFSISGIMPADAWAILDTQVKTAVSASEQSLRISVVLGILITLWSSGAGIRAIMRAMNIAYGERESRKFAAFYGIAGSLTLSVILFLWLALAVVIGVPAVLSWLSLDAAAEQLTRVLPWCVLIGLFMTALIILYRIGPSRRAPKLRWTLPGAIFAVVTWSLMSAAFSRFIASFGTYNEVYGSISAVIILLIWFWLTAMIVILGAEINAECERQTTCDTTQGKTDRPIGKRGAAMADFMGRHSKAAQDNHPG